MPYAPHALLAFGGNLGAGDGDIWTCGIRLRTTGADPFEEFDEEQYLDDTAVPALMSWFQNSATAISLYARLSWAKCNWINEQGQYHDPGHVHERYFTAVQGGSSAGPYPYQLAVCYTWETNATTRGPASRGRIYVPMVTSPIDGDTGLFTPTVAQGHANAGAALINSLDAPLGLVFGGTVRPCISSNLGDGVNNQIDRVSCDTRFDVQRRRANAMTPARRETEVNY